MRIFVVTFKPDCAGPEIQVYAHKYYESAVARFMAFAADMASGDPEVATAIDEVMPEDGAWDGSPLILAGNGSELALAAAHLER